MPFIFGVLILLALIAAIWGQKTAQGCFHAIALPICLLIGIACTIAWPPAGLFGIGFAAFILFCKWGANKNRELEQQAAAKEQDDLAQRQAFALNQMQQMHAYLQSAASSIGTPTVSAPNIPSVLAVTPRGRLKGMRAAPNARYEAMRIDYPHGARYAVNEMVSDQLVTMSEAEFMRDWIVIQAPSAGVAPAVPARPNPPAPGPIAVGPAVQVMPTTPVNPTYVYFATPVRHQGQGAWSIRECTTDKTALVCAAEFARQWVQLKPSPAGGTATASRLPIATTHPPASAPPSHPSQPPVVQVANPTSRQAALPIAPTPPPVAVPPLLGSSCPCCGGLIQLGKRFCSKCGSPA